MILVSVLLALQAPAANPAPGFNAEALAEATSRGDATAVRAALTRMEQLRAALILDPAGTPEIIDPMEARALRAALGGFDAASAHQIAYFMRGTVSRIAPSSTGPVAGFYNPLLDLWLVASLDRIGGAWRVASARLIDGAALRGSGGMWSEAADNAFGTLARNYELSIAAFDRRAGEATAGDAFEQLDERSNAWMSSLAAWRADAASVAVAEAVRAEIVAGRLARANIGSIDLARQIDGLPGQVRATMAVIGAVRRGDAETLIIASPLMPELLLLVDLGAGDRPTGLAILNLANAAATEA